MAMKLYSDASVQAIANAIRTKNGASTQYKIADMAPAILAIPTGGGSSPWALVETITVPADTRAININVSDYTSSYDVLFCYSDMYISPSDWVYIVKNGSSPSGGSYLNGKKTHTNGITFIIGRALGNNSNRFTATYYSGNGLGSTADAATNFYLYAYNSASVIQAGTIFKIFGVNYADL